MKAFGGDLHRGGGGEVAHSGKDGGCLHKLMCRQQCRCWVRPGLEMGGHISPRKWKGSQWYWSLLDLLGFQQDSGQWGGVFPCGLHFPTGRETMASPVNPPWGWVPAAAVHIPLTLILRKQKWGKGEDKTGCLVASVGQKTRAEACGLVSRNLGNVVSRVLRVVPTPLWPQPSHRTLYNDSFFCPLSQPVQAAPREHRSIGDSNNSQ